MLFPSQIASVYNRDLGESLYFAGATYAPINDEGVMMHITGVKTKSGNIRTRVEYLTIHPDQMDVENDTVPFLKTLSPVNFEKFLNEMAMKVAVEKKGNRLIELSYRMTGISESPKIDEQHMHRLFKLFLILATQYKDTDKAYQSIRELVTHLENGGTEDTFGALIEKYVQAV